MGRKVRPHQSPTGPRQRTPRRPTGIQPRPRAGNVSEMLGPEMCPKWYENGQFEPFWDACAERSPTPGSGTPGYETSRAKTQKTTETTPGYETSRLKMPKMEPALRTLRIAAETRQQGTRLAKIRQEVLYPGAKFRQSETFWFFVKNSRSLIPRKSGYGHFDQKPQKEESGYSIHSSRLT